MAILLTIGITSYKRIDELVRCINSIKTKYIDEVEVLISEDKSPLSLEIQKTVGEIANNSQYNIRFSTNDVNLGYDMNLGSIIKKSNGKYIFFMSDDDAIQNDCIDEIVEYIKESTDVGVIYAPFIYSESGKKDRVRGGNHYIEPGAKNAKRLIYDSILFSGLIFRKEYVEVFDSSRFKNLNYFQVYMFLKMILHHGGYYFENPSVLCIGDGENAYGLSESSGGNELLANRKSVKSNLEFNKTLIRVIKMFDQEENCNVMNSFRKQYSLRSYSGLSIARMEGIEYFKDYWRLLNALDIHLSGYTKIYYLMLLVLGTKKSNRIMNVFRSFVKKE